MVAASEVAAAEPPTPPEDILECVLEEPPEPMMDPTPGLEKAEGNLGRAPSNVVHGPNYYFYQGESLPFLM